MPVDPPALWLRDVTVSRDGRDLVAGIDWAVRPHERWAVLGRNGSGKTTLVRIASLYLHPTQGGVEVLGERLGRCDVRMLRRRIGLAGAGMSELLRPGLTGCEIVMTAKFAALEPWWHTYDDADRARAELLLDRLGVGHTAGQPLHTMSSGERQRVLLARTLMTDPELLLLDEPTAALDLGAREELVTTLDSLAADPSTPATVLVTHHVEEIPPSFTHVLLLREGRAVASGTIDRVLTADALSDCFGIDLVLARDDASGRWSARRR